MSIGFHELSHHILLQKNAHPDDIYSGEEKAWEMAKSLAFEHNFSFDLKVGRKELINHEKGKYKEADAIKSYIFDLEKQGPYFVGHVVFYVLNDVRKPRRRICGLNLKIMKNIDMQKKIIEFRDYGETGGKIMVINYSSNDVVILKGQQLFKTGKRGKLVSTETCLVQQFGSKIISVKDFDESSNQTYGIKKDVFSRYTEDISFNKNTCGLIFFKDRNTMSIRIFSTSIFKMARKRILAEMMLAKTPTKVYPPLGSLDNSLESILKEADFREYRGVGGRTMKILKQGSMVGTAFNIGGDDPLTISLDINI